MLGTLSEPRRGQMSHICDISALRVKDLATCCRSTAIYRFGDAAMKEYLYSIIQHTRRFYICNKHSEYVGM